MGGECRCVCSWMLCTVGMLEGASLGGCGQGRAVARAATVGRPPPDVLGGGHRPPPRTSGGGDDRPSPPRPGPAHPRRHLNALGCLAKAVRCWEPVISYARCFISATPTTTPPHSKMTVKAAEASGPTLTYSKMRGMVTILIGERRGGFFEDAWGGCDFFPQAGLTIWFLLSLSFS